MYSLDITSIRLISEGRGVYAELLSRVVTSRQVCDEWRDLPCHRVHGDDARTVVWWCTAVSRLIGIGRKEPAPL